MWILTVLVCVVDVRSGCLLNNMQKTKAFQSGDNQTFCTLKIDKNKVSQLEGVAYDLLPDSRLKM